MDSGDFQTQNLPSRVVRRTYLVTYSQANLEIFPTRESFGKAIAEAFDRESGKVKTQHWACCLERHQDGGQHYHVAIKLTGPKRWVGVKEHFTKTFGIVVNFSEGHDNYYTAYKYICKSDDDIFKSQDHRDLSEVGSPRTKKCIKAFRASKLEERKRKSNDSANPDRKFRGLSNLDVSDFLKEKNIASSTELFAVANAQLLEITIN
eukprot:gene10104-18760_t